jgi:hypothetical protein
MLVCAVLIRQADAGMLAILHRETLGVFFSTGCPVERKNPKGFPEH